MARKPSVFPEGVAQHIIQRGNDRQVCFGDDSDFAAYADWLREAAERWGVSVRARMVDEPAAHDWIDPACVPERN